MQVMLQQKRVHGHAGGYSGRDRREERASYRLDVRHDHALLQERRQLRLQRRSPPRRKSLARPPLSYVGDYDSQRAQVYVVVQLRVLESMLLAELIRGLRAAVVLSAQPTQLVIRKPRGSRRHAYDVYPCCPKTQGRPTDRRGAARWRRKAGRAGRDGLTASHFFSLSLGCITLSQNLGVGCLV